MMCPKCGKKEGEKADKRRTPSLDIRVEGINEDESREPRPNSFVFSIVRKTPVKVLHPMFYMP